MAEPGISITYSDLASEVAQYLGYSRSSAEWTTKQSNEIDRYVQSGIRQFYYPPAVSEVTAGYEWSFLKPATTVDTVADQGEIELPADFGRLIGDVYFSPETGYPSIPQVTQGDILRFRQKNAESARPQLVAIRFKEGTGTTGQRQEVMFYPTPDAVYTLHYQYEAFPYSLSYDRPYPLGGAKFSEVILESCLAVAEQRADNMQGTHYQRFAQLLADAVMRDQRHKASFFGQIGDSGGERPDIGRRYLGTFYPITYEGDTW